MFIKLALTGLGLFGLWKWASSPPSNSTSLPLSAADTGLYWLALKYESDPKLLSDLAANFKAKGATKEAAALIARATLQSAGPTVNGDCAAIIQGALRSERPEAIHKLSVAFEGTGRGSSAKLLRSYARGLRVHQAVQMCPAPQPPPPPPPPMPAPTMSGDRPDGGNTGEGDTNVARHGTEGTDTEEAPNMNNQEPQ